MIYKQLILFFLLLFTATFAISQKSWIPTETPTFENAIKYNAEKHDNDNFVIYCKYTQPRKNSADNLNIFWYDLKSFQCCKQTTHIQAFYRKSKNDPLLEIINVDIQLTNYATPLQYTGEYFFIITSNGCKYIEYFLNQCGKTYATILEKKCAQ